MISFDLGEGLMVDTGSISDGFYSSLFALKKSFVVLSFSSSTGAVTYRLSWLCGSALSVLISTFAKS